MNASGTPVFGVRECRIFYFAPSNLDGAVAYPRSDGETLDYSG